MSPDSGYLVSWQHLNQNLEADFFILFFFSPCLKPTVLLLKASWKPHSFCCVTSASCKASSSGNLYNPNISLKLHIWRMLPKGSELGCEITEVCLFVVFCVPDGKKHVSEVTSTVLHADGIDVICLLKVCICQYWEAVLHLSLVSSYYFKYC